MILKIKHLTSILIFLSGCYFFFIGYQNIIIEKITDHNISTKSELKQNSKVIKDINLQKNKTSSEKCIAYYSVKFLRRRFSEIQIFCW